MRKTTFHALLGAGILLVSPLAASAAGLGKLTVLSAPGAPLQAQIDLTGVNIDEVTRLKARLADEHAYEQAHVRYTPAIKTLTLSLLAGADGAPFLKLSSSQPVNVQDLNVLIELDSGGTHQDYAVTLGSSGTPAVPVDMPAAAEPAAPRASAPSVATPAAVPPAKVKVKGGDTLYGIAAPRLAPGQSLSQLVVAIYRANPQGFSQKNMNRLLAGRVLNMPSREAVAAIAPAEALKVIRQQVQSWHAYQQQVAEHATLEGAPAKAPASQQAGGKIQAATRDEGATAAAPPQDVLRLSRGASPANAAPNDAGARKERIAALQEEQAARAKGLQEETERIQALQKNIGEMNQLLAVKDPHLAQMQQQAVKPRPAAKPAPAAPKPAAAPAAGQDVRRKAALAALAVAVLALLAVVGLLFRRRREPLAAETVEPAAMATPEVALVDAAVEPPPAVIPEDPLILADLYLAQQRVDQAEEVLTNALTQDASRTDIQIKLLELHAMRGNAAAYEALARQYQANHAGRKAEEWRQICAQGREMDPENPLYATGNDAAPGVEQAFAATPAVAGLVMDTPVEMMDAGAPDAQPAAFQPPLAEIPATETPVAPDTAPAAAEPPALAFSLDEIPSFTEAAPVAGAPVEMAPATLPAANVGIDLDLDFRLDAASDSSAAPEARTAAALDNPAAAAPMADIRLDLDVPLPGSGDTAVLEQPAAVETAAASGEVATKLDLARAYIEMGDVDGAREILEEVLTEADGEQLAEARMLWEKSR